MVTLIAHRGESYLAPENTMAAFNLAWDLGDHGIELDIHLTRDHQIICCHDADTWRTTGQRAKLVIAESTADELRKLDVGQWKDPKYAGQRMPMLSEVLGQLPADKIVLIEVKPAGSQICQALIATLRQLNINPNQVRVMSFHDETIAEFNDSWPDGPDTHLLGGFKHDPTTGLWSPTVEQFIARARQCRADVLNLQNKEPMDANLIKKIHDAGMKCYVWTEDDPAAAARFIQFGVDGITSNRAHWLAQNLKGNKDERR